MRAYGMTEDAVLDLPVSKFVLYYKYAWKDRTAMMAHSMMGALT